MPKVKKLEISNFRGIATRLVCDFTPAADQKPVSLLITGDNGAGKSSIVDALEFGLQGHLGQTKFFRSSMRPSIQSYATSEMPEITITFSDDTVFKRGTIRDEGRLLVTNRYPHADFSVSPFVIRRADILRFHDTPEDQRILVFWNYLKNPSSTDWIEQPSEQLERLRERRLESKIERDRLFKELADKLNVSVEQLPKNPPDLKYFLKQLSIPAPRSSKAEGHISKKQKDELDADTSGLVKAALKAGEKQRELKEKVKLFEIDRDEKSFPKHLIPAMQAFLNNVSPRLSKSFSEISNASFIQSIDLKYGDEIGQLVLRVALVLNNGTTCSPHQVLSEANLDLLALLFFVAVAQESATQGQAKLLILDDVLQSVDASIRVAFVDYLLREMPDWQYVFTVHDRLWQAQLRNILQRWGHSFIDREICRWSFTEGPIILDSHNDLDSELKHALETGAGLALICSQAGLLLETICDRLSINLPIAITRRNGDRYTLGDFWPGIYKALRKTGALKSVDEIDKWLHLRNLLGAHYNEWALSTSRSEAERFAQAVLGLLLQVRCNECNRWIEMNNVQSGLWECRCGSLKLTKLTNSIEAGNHLTPI